MVIVPFSKYNWTSCKWLPKTQRPTCSGSSRETVLYKNQTTWGLLLGFKYSCRSSLLATKDVLQEGCLHLKDSIAILMTHTVAHFSNALLKEQMITSVKNVNNAGQINAKLIDFSKICPKTSNATGCFLPIVFWGSLPRNFLQDRPIFLPICPWKYRKIWLFSLTYQKALYKCHGWV